METFWKILAVLLVVTMLAGLALDQVEGAELYKNVVGVVSVLLLFILIAVGGERATEILKVFMRWLFGSFLGKVPLFNKLQPTGVGSWFLALIPALLAVYQFDVSDLLGNIPLFENVDASLVQQLTVLFIWTLANISHKPVSSVAGGAQPVTQLKLPLTATPATG